MQPSSLSLAERLAFFSSLCEGGGATTPTSTAPTGGRFSSRASSCASSRSPPYNSMERTPCSSGSNTCSSNVTPTPMECTPSLQQELPQQEEQPQQLEREREQEQEQEQFSGFVELSRSATAPPAAATTMTTTTITTPLLETTSLAPRRIKIRTVGKLVLPETFLSDRNNNNHRNSCIARIQTLEDIHISMGVRTIGKIKSPFIEQQQHKKEQQQQQFNQSANTQSKSLKMDYKSTPHTTHTNNHSSSNSNSNNDSSDDAQSSDSGKENCAANQQKHQQQMPQQQPQQQQLQQEAQQLPDLRRKLTHFTQITVQQKVPQITTTVNRRHTTELGGTTASTCGFNTRAAKGRSASHVDERYAKYFGINDSDSSTTTLVKTQSAGQVAVPQEALNEHVRLPHTSGVSLVQKRRELLKRTRAMSLETSGSGSGGISPTATPSLKRAHSPAISGKLSIASFEDIVVTPDELHAAGHEFKRLCGEILGT